MTNKEYRQHEGISKSSLQKITKSPLHFKYSLDHPDEPTPDLIFGTAAHKYILEKDDFWNEVCIIPVCDRRTKEGKEIYAKFLTECENKTAITSDEFERIKEMYAVIQDNKYAVALLKDAECEQSFFWEDDETKEKCKCRPDAIKTMGGRNIIIDYKTTQDAETSAFMKSAIKFGYDLQAGMYSEGMKKNTGKEYTFVFIAQEKKAPYALNIVECSADFIAEGNQLFHDLLGIYHDCKVKDEWPGYMPNGINVLGLPDWLKREVNTDGD